MNTSDQFSVHGIEEELRRHRDSIPPANRCPKCEGNGMVLANGGVYEVCPLCGATGKMPGIDGSK